MKDTILVISEHRGSEADQITLELISRARALSDAWGAKVAVLIMGFHLEPVIHSLRSCGADTLLVADHEALQDYRPEVYASLITQTAIDYRPRLIVMGYTYLGMEVGPSVSVRLGGTLATNCSELEVQNGKITVVRPMFAGTVQARVKLNGPLPYLISFEKGTLPKANRSSEEASIEKVPVEINEGGLRSKILRVITPLPGALDISKANILVSVGRGIGSPDKIDIIRRLADALKGSLACSRPVVDMGWLPAEHQVGISAKTVAPNVYIACGISGASQHVAAMRDSGLIVAINKDPNAPIFRVAHCGFVGDLFDILPSMIQCAGGSI